MWGDSQTSTVRDTDGVVLPQTVPKGWRSLFLRAAFLLLEPRLRRLLGSALGDPNFDHWGVCRAVSYGRQNAQTCLSLVFVPHRPRIVESIDAIVIGLDIYAFIRQMGKTLDETRLVFRPGPAECYPVSRIDHDDGNRVRTDFLGSGVMGKFHGRDPLPSFAIVDSSRFWRGTVQVALSLLAHSTRGLLPFCSIVHLPAATVSSYLLLAWIKLLTRGHG